MLFSSPMSVLAITLTLRSFCTLPMISTAWPFWRCASYGMLVILPVQLFGRLLTRFRWIVISPSASMVAESPRIWRTLPMMRTFWCENCSRYLALTLGVASMMAGVSLSGKSD